MHSYYSILRASDNAFGIDMNTDQSIIYMCTCGLVQEGPQRHILQKFKFFDIFFFVTFFDYFSVMKQLMYLNKWHQRKALR